MTRSSRRRRSRSPSTTSRSSWSASCPRTLPSSSSEIRLLPSPQGAATAIATLTPEDLPDRLQAWAPLDRLVWQDVDASTLTPGQLASLRSWIAGGGRLVIVGGTAGADTLAAFPDDLLPYRPTAVLDVDPTALRPVLGGVPDGAPRSPRMPATPETGGRWRPPATA